MVPLVSALSLWWLAFIALGVMPNFAQAGEPQPGAPVVSQASEDAPKLSLPLQCELGKTCFIQSYVDIDLGPGVQDFACGSSTYEGHSGTDFRLLSVADAQKKVAVLASAEGIVKGVRDGMPDILLRNSGGPDSVKNRECGNGVVIDHGRGWETQYCHMLKGSVITKTGDTVTRGQRLGDTGFSGDADFAHVHFEVRHNGQVIDPFSAQSQNAACLKDKPPVSGLWQDEAAKALHYTNGEAINAGFAADVPSLTSLEEQSAPAAPNSTSKALVFFASFINLRAGDQVKIEVTGPEGFMAGETSKPLERNKATWLSYGGKKLTKSAWPKGSYAGTALVLRDGKSIAGISRTLDLPQ